MTHFLRFSLLCFLALLVGSAPLALAQPSFVNFESGQVRPLALSPDGGTLIAANTPDNRIEIFSVSGAGIAHSGTVAVGMEPVAVAFRSNTEVWVVNHLSDSVSIVDLTSSPARVTRTLLVGDEPRDIVFAGTGGNRAFVSTAHRGQHREDASISGVPGAGDPQLTTDGVGRADVWVFDATALGATLGGTPVSIESFFADTPRALAVSGDGLTVYVAAFFSGNRTTTVSDGVVCDGFAGAGSCGGDGITSPDGLPGGLLPGGNPGPSANVEAVTAPEVGLIVRFNAVSGLWEDELGRNWNNGVRFDLPDEDVFAFNADSLAPVAVHATVGTTLFNMAVNPASGDLFVTNTESINEVRFEGPGVVGGSTVQGHLAESRITIIDSPNTTTPSGLNIKPRHLNKHINYAILASDPTFDPSTRVHSLATPVDMAFNAAGTTLYVAAFGSGKVGVFDTASLEANTFDPTLTSADYLQPSGGGPSGLALDEANGRIYVLTRFDNSVSVMNLATGVEEDHVALHNPEPSFIVKGRPFLYDAFRTSANGETSCSSCHVFGDLDQLGWDLGNPDDVVTQNPVEIKLGIAAPPSTNGGADTDEFHPMKGPMTTQTLRGLANSGAMHWRGDRVDGFFGVGADEALSFNNFIVAFEGLVGREHIVNTNDMNAFTDFSLSLTLPPNPVRALDNSLDPAEQAGRDFYFGPRQADAGFTCNGCHTLNAAQGFFGTDGDASFENETQIMKIAHLRNAYQKVGMFGMPNVSFFNGGDNGHKGDQIRGFGFLHDGSTDTLFRFFRATVFNATASTGFNGGDPQRREMEAFMLAFDNDIAPVVGQQVTLDSTNSGVAGPRIDLLLARSAAPFVSKILGGAVSECQLIVKGIIAGEARGWLRSGGTFVSDRSAEPSISDGALRTLAATPGQELTYTCVPPGSGQRMGIDRDEDGILDGDDNCPSLANALQTDSDVDDIGDACDDTPGFAASVQNSNQQSCITGINKRMAKVVKTVGKEASTCVKNFAKGKLTGLIEDCVTADLRGKREKAEEKTSSEEDSRCSVTPTFGFAGAEVANAAAVQGGVDLLHDLFGPWLDLSLVAEADDREESRCQAAVVKVASKCQDTFLKDFNDCKKAGLKGGTLTTQTDLEACLGSDSKGKIDSVCSAVTGKLASTVTGKCTDEGVTNLSVVFPGCGTDVEADFATCVERSVSCRVCQTLNAADAMAVDCDVFDNAMADNSCS